MITDVQFEGLENIKKAIFECSGKKFPHVPNSVENNTEKNGSKKN